MSQTIDERVVEMRFDNKEFESGVKKSLDTLDELKKSLDLDEAAKSFNKIDKAANDISLEGITAGIEALQKRFSTLGIVGMRVIENITDSLMGMASKAMNYVNDAIVSGGLKRAQNIENAHFQLQALLKDEAAVQAVMDDAMASVDGTAYAYDEAAKAASQFAASGMRAGEDMRSALIGITGVAAMTNSEYENISRIFTTVAGNGRLMGDQLLQLSSRGLNAAATIADYFREVQGQSKITESDIREMVSKGQVSFETFAAAMNWAFGESAFRANETFTGALSNMRSALARIGAEFFSPLIEQNSDLILLINTLRERINDVKKALTFDEQRSAISGLAKETGWTTDTLNKFFKTIDEQGSVTTTQLTVLSKTGVNAAGSLMDYINGVTSGTIRSTYATKNALDELTGGLEINEDQLREFVEEGKIDLKTFTSAMETAYGDQKALSKQFTTSVLNMAKSVSAYLKNLDLTKPLSLIYYGVESVKNVFKGLYSVIKPVGKAFSEVFRSFGIDNVIKIADKIETLTSKMKLSEKGSQNLHDAFYGLFSVAKLVIDVIVRLIKAFIPASEPIGSLTDLVLSLAGAMGRGLTSFTEWVRSSPALSRAYEMVAAAIRSAMTAIASFIDHFDEFIDYIYNLPIVQKIINGIVGALYILYDKGGEYLTSATKSVKDFGEKLVEIAPERVQKFFVTFSEKIKEVGDDLRSMDLTDISEGFRKFTGILGELLEVLKGNEGLNTFVGNLKQYFQDLGDAFTFDRLIDNIEKFKGFIGGFVDWIRDNVSPIFEGFSFGGAVATAGGFGIIYAIIRVTKTFDKIAKNIKAIPDLLGAVRGTLAAYQKDLKADAILKIAKAIGILAVSITILSFADMDRAWQATIMLAAIGATLTIALGYFLNGVANAKGVNTALNTMAKGLSKSLNNLTKAVKWKAIGKAIKDMALAIGIIIASILALSYAYSKDSDGNITKALTLVSEIAAVMAGVIMIMSALGNKLDAGMKAFGTASAGVLALAASLLIVIGALNKLFKMELPSDWESKIGILTKIFVGLGALTIVVALASKIASNNGFYSNSGGTTMLTTSQSGSIAGSIIAVAAALYVSVLALEKLFTMNLPSDYKSRFGLLTGLFVELALLIVALGVASGLSEGGLKATGSLLAMCVVIATIVGSLIVLSAFPGDKLLGRAGILGLTLVALATALAGAGKIIESGSWKSVLAMAAEIGAITIALGVLSMIPVDSLTKAGVALGFILLALAGDFYAVSKITDKLSFASIIAMAANIVIIAIALAALANQPWEGMLAGAGSISLVLLAVAGAFGIISSIKLDLKTIGGFIAGIIGIAVIGYILKETASGASWESLLVAASSISLVLLALSAAMVICTAAGEAASFALIGMGILDLFIVNLAIILASLGALSDDAEAFLNRGGEILKSLGTYLGEFVGNIIGGVLEGITNSLPSVGQNLSDFANNAGDFFEIIGGLDAGILTGAKNLAEVILVLTAAELINGVANFASFLIGRTSFADFGNELKDFGKSIAAFASEVKGISGGDVEAASNCAKALAELYANMPKENGWMQKIMGQKKSLAEFAEELVPFGAAMVRYSNSVSGKIDQESVEASVKAAEVLLAFNENLPNMGGLASLIFGHQKTLAEFAEELVPFGEAMVSYSNAVSGKIDAEAITASANAAEALAKLQNALGNSGGIVSWFTGDNTLKDFGKGLKTFGESLAGYAESIKNVSAEKLSLVTEEVRKLIEVMGGTNSLDTSGMNNFSNSLRNMGNSGVDEFVGAFNNSMPRVTNSVGSMMKTADEQVKTGGKTMSNSAKTTGENTANAIQTGLNNKKPSVLMTTKNLSEGLISQMKTSLPTTTFTSIGEGSITALTNGVANKKPTALATTKSLSEGLISQMKTSLPSSTFTDIGSGTVTALSNGVTNKKSTAMSSSKNVCDAVVSQFKTSLPDSTFNANGANVVTALSTGIGSKTQNVVKSAKDLCTSTTKAIQDNLKKSDMESIGSNVAEGLANGISSKINSIKESVVKAANSAIDSARNTLAVKSPSRVFYAIGEFVSIGLAKGIAAKISEVSDASKDLGEESIDTMNNLVQKISNTINDDPNFEPVIKPVMDLSNVEKAADDISSMFQRFNLASTYGKALAVSGSFNSRGRNNGFDDEKSTATDGEDGKNLYVFNQNNYSPKSLSRSEIYRQTKSLFSRLEEVTK